MAYRIQRRVAAVCVVLGGQLSACGGGGSGAAPAPSTPAITWATPAPVSVGSSLGAAQLNATADAPGTFLYSPAAGTVLLSPGGTTLSVTFVPSDSNAYTTATSSVVLTVNGVLAAVNVDFGTSLAMMPANALGVDSAVYDNILISSAVASTLKAGGVNAVRYPGGSYADLFNWQTTTMNDGAYIDTNDSFTNFMNTVVNPAGAKAIITVNYGSNPQNDGGGDPNVAAAWVQYANITNGWGIKYWEIGNEVGGNGYYANQDWEYDLHFLDQTAAARVGQPALSPAAYGQNALAFINAMKAVDPTIRCGVGIAQPGDFPDTAVPSYNQQVLSQVAGVVDFVIIHWYPGGSESALLQTPSNIPAIVTNLQAELSSTVGARAAQVELLVTETGSGSVTGPATALFAADEFLSWLENGASNVEYQELHNGFLASGTPGVTDNSPLGPYYGVQMSGILASAGDTFVKSTSNSTLIGVHAALKSNHQAGVTLINKDPSNAYAVAVTISGVAVQSGGTRYDFGQSNFTGTNPSSGISASPFMGSGSATFTIAVPAYTTSTLILPTS